MHKGPHFFFLAGAPNNTQEAAVMKGYASTLGRGVLGSFVLFGMLHAQSSGDSSRSLWVSAYYAGWMQGWNNNGHLPAQEIDYSAVTHIIHFSIIPNADGSLRTEANSILEENSRLLTANAHAAGRKVIISVGGWQSETGFRGATSPLNLSTFVGNLISFMLERGYDGIDLDWERLYPTDAIQYIALCKALSAAFDTLSPRPLLTAACADDAEIFALVHQYLDQINLMTYDFSGAWPGWVTWHNAPLHDGGFNFPCCPWKRVPSADQLVQRYVSSGVPAHKIGIGIDFYGYVWNGGDGTTTGGVTRPRQQWTAPPWVRPNVPYYTIIENYFHPSYHRWDDTAHAAYLSIDKEGSVDDKFISFDDEKTVASKVEYVRNKNIGGVIIWELGGGYLRDGLPERDRLLQAVKRAANLGPTVPTSPLLVHPENGSVEVELRPELSWLPGVGPTTYHIQISSDSLFDARIVDDSTLTNHTFEAELEHNTTYFWRISARNNIGWSPFSPAWRFTTLDTSSSTPIPPAPVIPREFVLHQNYPNPFNGSTAIRFEIAQAGDVLLEIYSLQGELINRLASGHFEAGAYEVSWTPGKFPPSGIYFCRLRHQVSFNAPAEDSKRVIYLK